MQDHNSLTQFSNTDFVSGNISYNMIINIHFVYVCKIIIMKQYKF